MPESACRQLEDLVFDKKIIVVNEKGLEPQERRIYDMIYNRLAEVLIDPRRPNKNKGEVCSLAYAKVKTITVFATDEKGSTVNYRYAIEYWLERYTLYTNC
jgi:hypothetical protein